MLDRIRAVFAEAQAEGMDQLYDVINAARDLAPDSDFQACYDLVMTSGGPEVEIWINFTVTTATRFDLDDQPEPEQFFPFSRSVVMPVGKSSGLSLRNNEGP